LQGPILAGCAVALVNMEVINTSNNTDFVSGFGVIVDSNSFIYLYQTTKVHRLSLCIEINELMHAETDLHLTTVLKLFSGFSHGDFLA